MKDTKKQNSKAAKKAKMLELLETAQPGEAVSCNKTLKQNEILEHADVQTLQKKFDLHLEMGTYFFRKKCSVFPNVSHVFR